MLNKERSFLKKEYESENLKWHGYCPISVPNKLPFDIIKGETNLSMHDFMVYVMLRKYSRPYPHSISTLPDGIIEKGGNPWVCEAYCDCITPEFICNTIYDFKKVTQKKKLAVVLKSIANLIDSGLVVCYDKKRKAVYTGQDYLILNNYKGVMFYFLVNNGYFALPEEPLDRLIECCAEKKDYEVEYFVLLYAVLEYNFKISKSKKRCWLDMEQKEFFMQRQAKWRKFEEIFSEIGIKRVCTKESYHGTFVTSLSFEKIENQTAEPELNYKTQSDYDFIDDYDYTGDYL